MLDEIRRFQRDKKKLARIEWKQLELLMEQGMSFHTMLRNIWLTGWALKNQNFAFFLTKKFMKIFFKK
jgi:hypothetical protein